MKLSPWTLFFCFALTSLFTMAQISFTESSSSQNINVSHGSNQFIGGVSFFDFNNDGWDDLTFASQDGDPIYFYQNNNGTLNQVNLNLLDYQKDTRQVNWVDIDNDGDNDLFVVTHNASNKLYLNDGSLNFTDITVASGISTSILSSWGGSWGDYNNDGFLDLFLCVRDIANELQPNILYRNNGDNTFTNVNSTVGISNSNHLSFCASFFDFNNDGWQDIYIANDRFIHPNILYKNNGDGTFTDVSVSSGANIAIDAMSTTIEDYNNDGWLDIYVTNTSAGNYFLRNNGNDTFTNIAAANGTGFYSVAWGAVFLDGDNDMDLDLYVSGMRDGSTGQLPSAFYENVGAGTFSIPSNAGFATDTAESYSNAIGDVNNDGFADITVINKTPNANFLWINSNASGNNWLKVSLEGNTSNKMGVGSWIEIQVNGNKQYRYTICGEGYTSQNSGSEFFGLGTNTMIDYVKVTWLSGIQDVMYNVSANQELHIEESSTLSVQSEVIKEGVSVYPNPSPGKFKIDISNDYTPFTLDLIDVFGHRVFSQTKEGNTSELDLSFLNNGLYFLVVHTNKGKITKKIVVNH